MRADTCKDAQRNYIMPHSNAHCKRFLLLCNMSRKYGTILIYFNYLQYHAARAGTSVQP